MTCWDGADFGDAEQSRVDPEKRARTALRHLKKYPEFGRLLGIDGLEDPAEMLSDSGLYRHFKEAYRRIERVASLAEDLDMYAGRMRGR